MPSDPFPLGFRVADGGQVVDLRDDLAPIGASCKCRYPAPWPNGLCMVCLRWVGQEPRDV